MTAIHPKTRQRIEDAVRRIERTPVGAFGGGRSGGDPGATHQVLLVAEEDIEHGEIGDAKLAQGSGGTFSVYSASEVYRVVNLRQKIWSGSLLVAQWASWRTTAANVESLWLCNHAWSATRIRGTAQTQIAPGETKTLTSLVPMDGHHAPVSAQVYLPTAHVTVKLGKVVWAELVYRATGGSRWEVYSADCDGESA